MGHSDAMDSAGAYAAASGFKHALGQVGAPAVLAWLVSVKAHPNAIHVDPLIAFCMLGVGGFVASWKKFKSPARLVIAHALAAAGLAPIAIPPVFGYMDIDAPPVARPAPELFIAVALATLSRHFFERPLLRWGPRLTAREDAEASSATAALSQGRQAATR